MLTIIGVALIGSAIVLTLSLILTLLGEDEAAAVLTMTYVLIAGVTLLGAVGGDLVGWWDVGLD